MNCLRGDLRAVKRLLRSSSSLSHDVLQKLRWFQYALEHEGNISLTCRHFGISRTTFLRWAERFDPRNPFTLEEQSRRPHHVRAPETDETIVALIREYRVRAPYVSKEEIRVLLFEEHGVVASASTIGRVISRNRFFFGDSEAHARKRQETTLKIDVNRDYDTAWKTTGDDVRLGEDCGEKSIPFSSDDTFLTNT